MSNEAILKELSEIVPRWQHVDLTRKGYNDQYIETLKKLLDFVIVSKAYAYQEGYVAGGISELTKEDTK